MNIVKKFRKTTKIQLLQKSVSDLQEIVHKQKVAISGLTELFDKVTTRLAEINLKFTYDKKTNEVRIESIKGDV